MTTPLLYPDVVESRIAKQTLAMLIEQAFEAAHQSPRSDRRVIRVEVPVEGLDALSWLEAQGQRSRGYWCDRRREFELAGVGTADIITAEAECNYDELFESLRAGVSTVHPNLHYYGGMRFNLHTAPGAKWKTFGAYRFVLPKFEVLTRGAQTYLACNAVLRGDDQELAGELLAALDAMPFPGDEQTAPLPHCVSRTDTPNEAEWTEQVERTLAEFRRGALEKAVLARESVFAFDHPIDPVAILRQVSRNTEHTHAFCFQPKAGTAFIGVSPERLYKRQDRFIRTEAVAGTRPRGGNDDADERIGRELLESEKDRREHRYVLDAVQGELSKRCSALHATSDISVLKLNRCQHLYARVEGILDEFDTDADLLRALHPTPAVGGHPTDAAMRLISELERFDRGWYAGPVGWVGFDGADFAVAIRSALVTENQLSVYAGAGIVEGSIPKDEWLELENKIESFVSVLTGT